MGSELLTLFSQQDCPKTVVVHENFPWLLARLTTADSAYGQGHTQQKLPNWSAFNGLMSSNDVIRPSVAGYLPNIPSSPTQLWTVYLLLKRSVAPADQLIPHDVVIMLDQAIYALAQDVVYKCRQEFECVVLRMGDFHVAMTMLAVIGKRFADAGLKLILIESGIVGPFAITGVLIGKH